MKNWTKSLLKSAICVLLVCPALTSCFDDSALWDKITDLELQIDSLKNNLNDQVAAMNALMSDGSTISSCTKNADGSYLIELSNGTEFTAMPGGTDFSTILSYVKVDGKMCLATIGPDGKPVTLYDASGQPVVAGTAVEVKVEDGVYYLVINGKEYMTGFATDDLVQAFSSLTPLADASGQVYAVKFTFGGGYEVTVTVDGYKGVMFKLSSINNAVLSEYFIDYGATQTFLLETRGVVDYVMQIPDGWRVNERVEKVTGEVFVDITAPAKELVEMGAAVVAGDLRAVSVVEGGKAAVTRLSLSADPYKTYNVSSARAVVEMYEGVQKYIYGLTPVSDFDRTQIVAKVNEYLSASSSLPEGFFLSETVLNKSYEEISPELDVEESYVFWVVPAIYFEEGEQVGFLANEEMFRYMSLSPVASSVVCNDVTLLDAQLRVNVMGVNSVYAGTVCMRDDQNNLKTADEVLQEIIYNVSNGVYEPISVTSGMNYSGPASGYPDADNSILMDPNTEYMSWVIPIEEGKTQYVVTDVVYDTFKTKEIKEGGNLQVTCSEPVTDFSSISHTVTCEGAAMIYYAYLDKSTGDRYSDEAMSNTTRWNQICKAATFTSVRGSSVDAVIQEILPKTTMWLYAVAIGHDGLYGEVKCVSAATNEYSFNDLAVSVETVEIGTEEVTLKVSVTNGTATDFLYWVGRESDDFWVTKCKKVKTTAQQFMAANPDADAIVSVMNANGKIAEDGTLTLTNLSTDKNYVALVLAQDSEGKYSKVGYKAFKTAAIDLGKDYVAEGTDKWNETKKWIEDNIVWHEQSFQASAGSGQGFAAYSFDIKTPTDVIAYISCFSPEATELADMIVELETFCSKGRAVSIVVENNPSRPDWIDDRGKLHEGSLLNVSDFYVHGVPSFGYATYFPSAGHDSSSCLHWAETGACSNYVYYEGVVAQYLSFDYWKSWVVENCNYDYQGDPNHAYSYHLTDEAKIDALAQAYVDAYTQYYSDRKPILYVNDGSPLRMVNREAMGVGEDGTVVDKVIVLLKDTAGNYYAPMVIDVPNYF